MLIALVIVSHWLLLGGDIATSRCQVVVGPHVSNRSTLHSLPLEVESASRPPSGFWMSDDEQLEN
jgi:hypothetical protein